MADIWLSRSERTVPRVDGQLAMTRAFGDGKLKDHITSEPDIKVKKINDETDFIILASDGLWKVMSNQEAYDCIGELDDAQEAAEELIEEALSRESYDDVSCIVVVFH
ncbi:PREDICTED: probable protein phosphatase 2C 58 [Prunus mume]|uniref:Probable protein phosphatase 2C 58 n=1 Tax=Prunus mume TaxID=102107 RepID=A0ABM1LLA6_PRUMU|nr:PREDICTED: probable protein phosphatase 2C 58 [Prunus mume]